MGKYPFFVVNRLSHGPNLALEDVNISFFLSFFQPPTPSSFLLLRNTNVIYIPRLSYCPSQARSSTIELKASIYLHQQNHSTTTNLFLSLHLLISSLSKNQINHFTFSKSTISPIYTNRSAVSH